LATVHRAATVVCLALAALACRGAPAPAGTGHGGTLVIAAPGDADVLMPPVVGTQTAAHVIELIFPQLAKLGTALSTVDEANFVPQVAEHWEHRDSLTLVFHLDPRARWSDGTPITAADVVYSHQVFTDTLTGSPYRVNFAPIAAVTAEDPRTVAFRFRRAYPEQLYDAVFHLNILPKHLLDTIPNDRLASSAFAQDPVGAGPFRFARWQAGAELVIEADTTWFLGRPRLDRIVWRVMPDVSAAVTALLAGEADAMETILQREEIARVAADTALQLVPYPSPFLGLIAFNLRRGPFADREVRRAIAMAVDRATIVRALFGDYGDVPVGAVSTMVWIARGGDIPQLPYDTAQAARLLDAAGWRLASGAAVRTRGGRPLRFTLLVPTTSQLRQQGAVLVQDQLKKIGVQVDIEPVEYAVFEDRGDRGAFDALFLSRTLDPSPANLAQFWGSAAIGHGNLGGYASPAFDSLIAAAAAASGRDQALTLYQAALGRLNEDAPAVFVYAPRNHAAFHRRITGVTIRPDSWLATAAAWSIAPGRRLPRDQ
jgi:peptide/nickel transport system substrate-binding protein